MVWGLSLAGGVGVVLGMVVWWVVLGGLWCGLSSRSWRCSHAQGAPPPLSVGVGCFFLGFIHFGVGGWPSMSKKKRKKKLDLGS